MNTYPINDGFNSVWTVMADPKREGLLIAKYTTDKKFSNGSSMNASIWGKANQARINDIVNGNDWTQQVTEEPKSEAKVKVDRAQQVYDRAVEVYNKTKTTKSYEYLIQCERRLNERLTKLIEQA